MPVWSGIDDLLPMTTFFYSFLLTWHAYHWWSQTIILSVTFKNGIDVDAAKQQISPNLFILVSKFSSSSNFENEHPYFMYLTTNNEVITSFKWLNHISYLLNVFKSKKQFVRASVSRSWYFILLPFVCSELGNKTNISYLLVEGNSAAHLVIHCTEGPSGFFGSLGKRLFIFRKLGITCK